MKTPRLPSTLRVGPPDFGVSARSARSARIAHHIARNALTGKGHAVCENFANLPAEGAVREGRTNLEEELLAGLPRPRQRPGGEARRAMGGRKPTAEGVGLGVAAQLVSHTLVRDTEHALNDRALFRPTGCTLDLRDLKHGKRHLDVVRAELRSVVDDDVVGHAPVTAHALVEELENRIAPAERRSAGRRPRACG